MFLRLAHTRYQRDPARVRVNELRPRTPALPAKTRPALKWLLRRGVQLARRRRRTNEAACLPTFVDLLNRFIATHLSHKHPFAARILLILARQALEATAGGEAGSDLHMLGQRTLRAIVRSRSSRNTMMEPLSTILEPSPSNSTSIAASPRLDPRWEQHQEQSAVSLVCTLIAAVRNYRRERMPSAARPSLELRRAPNNVICLFLYIQTL